MVNQKPSIGPILKVQKLLLYLRRLPFALLALILYLNTSAEETWQIRIKQDVQAVRSIFITFTVILQPIRTCCQPWLTAVKATRLIAHPGRSLVSLQYRRLSNNNKEHENKWNGYELSTHRCPSHRWRGSAWLYRTCLLDGTGSPCDSGKMDSTAPETLRFPSFCIFKEQKHLARLRGWIRELLHVRVLEQVLRTKTSAETSTCRTRWRSKATGE